MGAVTEKVFQNILDDVERERQMLNALCGNFTAAYCCDLIADRMEPNAAGMEHFEAVVVRRYADEHTFISAPKIKEAILAAWDY